MLSCFFKEILADSVNSNNLGLVFQCSDLAVEFGFWLWKFRIKDERFYNKTGMRDQPITVS